MTLEKQLEKLQQLKDQVYQNAIELEKRGHNQKDILSELNYGATDSKSTRIALELSSFLGHADVTAGKIFGGKTKEELEWHKDEEGNPIQRSTIEKEADDVINIGNMRIDETIRREQEWKKDQAAIYGVDEDDIWNVSGGVGEFIPYMIGGGYMGAGKTLAGTIGRGALSDSVIAGAQYGGKDTVGEDVAREVGLGAIFGVGGQLLGSGFGKVYNKVFKGAGAKNDIISTAKNDETSTTKTANSIDDVDIAKYLNEKIGTQKKESIQLKNPKPAGMVDQTQTAFKVIAAKAGSTTIQDANGNIIERIGTRNWRNHNPGNLEYGEYAKSFGAIGTDGRFAVFPDYQTGRNAKANLIFNTKNYKDKTLKDAIARYAPNFENDTNSYFNAVLKKVGTNKKMSEYSPKERQIILDTMERVEGFAVGKEKILKGDINSQSQHANSAKPIEILEETNIKTKQETPQKHSIDDIFKDLEEKELKAIASLDTQELTPATKLYHDLKEVGVEDPKAYMKLITQRAQTIYKKGLESVDEMLTVTPIKIQAQEAAHSFEQTVGKNIQDMDFSDLSKHPRYQELLTDRENISAKMANRLTDPSLSNRGGGHWTDKNGQWEYEISRPLSANAIGKNYAADFSLTKQDVTNIRKGKITPEITQKLQNDLGRFENDPTYAQAVKGQINFSKDRALITLFKEADASTLVHELGHYFRRTLTDDELLEAQNLFGAKNGKWDVASEERFANAFTKYLSTGEAPTPALKTVFEKFKSWIRKTWEDIASNSDKDFKLSEAQKTFFRAILGDRDAAQKLFGKADITLPVKEDGDTIDFIVKQGYTKKEAQDIITNKDNNFAKERAKLATLYKLQYYKDTNMPLQNIEHMLHSNILNNKTYSLDKDFLDALDKIYPTPKNELKLSEKYKTWVKYRLNDTDLNELFQADGKDFTMVGDVKDLTNNPTEIYLDKNKRDIAGINNNPIVAYLKELQQKHPERFKNESDVYKHIIDVKNNATHHIDGTNKNNAIFIKKDNDLTKIIGIEKNNEEINKLIHALSSTKPNELKRLIKKQLEGSSTPSLHIMDGTNGVNTHLADDTTIPPKDLKTDKLSKQEWNTSGTKRKYTGDSSISAIKGVKRIEFDDDFGNKHIVERFTRPLYLPNGDRISGYMSNRDTVFGYDKNGEIFTIKREILDRHYKEKTAMFDEGNPNILFQAWGKDKEIDKLLGIPQELTSFGRNFAQFKGNPKEAIAHLMKVKSGQVRGALYHNEIGEIDIVWGKVIDPKKHTGYGLAHIIDKHGEDIARRLDDIIMGGKVVEKKRNRVVLENNTAHGVVILDWNGKDKKWVMTAFEPERQTLADVSTVAGKSDNLSPEADTTIPPKDLKTDEAYRRAIISGDRATADKIAIEYAESKGYTSSIKDTRMQHSAPNAADGLSKSIDDMSGLYPDDFYTHPHYYADGFSYDKKATNVLIGAKGNPEKLITVYRAVPKDVEAQHLRRGDWVTPTKEYAIEHGDSILDGEFRIITEKVPAKHLYTNADSIHELGYDDGLDWAYKNATNNKKILHASDITDEDIPLSKRFDEGNPNILFQKKIGDINTQINSIDQQIVKLSQSNDNIRYLQKRIGELEQLKNPKPAQKRALANNKTRLEVAEAKAGMTKLKEERAKLSGEKLQEDVKKSIPIWTKHIVPILEKIKKSDTYNATISLHRLNIDHKDYLLEKEAMQAELNFQKMFIEELHYGLMEFSTDARTSMYRYMTGDKVEHLHPELKKFADNMRQEIDSLGKQLVDEGIITQETYETWSATYLHRLYEKHFNKATLKRLYDESITVDQIFERGKKTIFKDEDLPDIKEYMYAAGYDQMVLDAAATFDDLILIAAQRSIADGGVELKRLPNKKIKARVDYTKAERIGMGEIEDIAFVLPDTLIRLQTQVAHSKFLKSLPDNIIGDTTRFSDAELEAGGYKKLSGKKYGYLNNKYVAKDVAKDIDYVHRQLYGDEKAALKAYGKTLSLWKKSKTIYMPTAHVNNFIGNFSLQFGAGANPLESIANVSIGTKTAYKMPRYKQLKSKANLNRLTQTEQKEYNSMLKDKNLMLFYDLEARGLFGRSGINDILMKNYATQNGISTKGMLQKIDNTITKIYGSEDDVHRFALAKHFMTNEGLTIEEAILEVNKNIPDYTASMTSMGDWLRRSGLAPFWSWSYHATPIMLRQIRERPARAGFVLGAISLLYFANDINPLSEKETPKGFSFRRVPISRDGEKVTTLKIDKLLPQADLFNWLPGTNEKNALIPENVRTLLIGGYPQSLAGWANNESLYFGTPLTRDDGAFGTYQKNIKYPIQNIAPTPGIISNLWNFMESKIVKKEKRRSNDTIDPRDTYQELLKLMGINTMTYNLNNLDKKTKDKK